MSLKESSGETGAVLEKGQAPVWMLTLANARGLLSRCWMTSTKFKSEEAMALP